jgi:cell division protein FtsQ
MKRMIKRILLLTLAAVCCVAVVVCGAYCFAQPDSSVCEEVCIVVKDSADQQFVDAHELETYLKNKSCYSHGKCMSDVDCHRIEECLLGHEMLRTVQCYKSPFGKVCISVKQRIPVLSVVSLDGCYYVDSDRQIMPIRGEMKTDIPLFKGSVSKRAAQEEYFDFAIWLTDDDYWNERILAIQVVNPKYLVLTQQDQVGKIVLGEIDNYQSKLMKLRKLYTKGFDQIGYPECKEYDLRFAGQVICRR